MTEAVTTTDEIEDPSGATYRRVGNQVLLGGQAACGNSPLVFTLPAGFRPAESLTFTAPRDTGVVVRVHILTDGSVMTELGEGSVSFDKIAFPVT